MFLGLSLPRAVDTPLSSSEQTYFSLCLFFTSCFTSNYKSTSVTPWNVRPNRMEDSRNILYIVSLIWSRHDSMFVQVLESPSVVISKWWLKCTDSFQRTPEKCPRVRPWVPLFIDGRPGDDLHSRSVYRPKIIRLTLTVCGEASVKWPVLFSGPVRTQTVLDLPIRKGRLPNLL